MSNTTLKAEGFKVVDECHYQYYEKEISQNVFARVANEDGSHLPEENSCQFSVTDENQNIVTFVEDCNTQDELNALIARHAS